MVVDGVQVLHELYGPIRNEDDSMSKEDSVLVEPHSDRLRVQLYLLSYVIVWLIWVD